MEQILELNRECGKMLVATTSIPAVLQQRILQFVGPFHSDSSTQRVMNECLGENSPILRIFDMNNKNFANFEWHYFPAAPNPFLLRATEVVCVGEFQFRPYFHTENYEEWGYSKTYILQGEAPDYTLTLQDMMEFIRHCQQLVFIETGFCDQNHCFFEGLDYIRGAYEPCYGS